LPIDFGFFSKVSKLVQQKRCKSAYHLQRARSRPSSAPRRPFSMSTKPSS
jgi:hypothetical protein